MGASGSVTLRVCVLITLVCLTLCMCVCMLDIGGRCDIFVLFFYVIAGVIVFVGVWALFWL